MTVSRSRRRTGALVLVAALVGAACGDGGTGGGDGSGGGDAAEPAATSPASVSSGTDTRPTDPGTTVTDGTTTADVAVPELLQFTAPLVGGGEFDGASVAGTTTLFWFWAPF